MKKFYSLVLMAAALLIGTNMQAVDVSSWDDLKANMKKGGEINLAESFEFTAPSTTDDKTWAGIWIGAEAENGTAPNVVLNLKGKTITINAGQNNQVLYPFMLTKGSLVVNGPGKIEVKKGEFTALGEGTNVFFVFGQGGDDRLESELNDPTGDDPFSHLTIGQNVEVSTDNGSCIVVDQLTSTNQTYINKVYATEPAKQLNYTSAKYAFGARVDVDGTLSSLFGTKCYGIKANGNLKKPADGLLAYAPYIFIHEHAEIYSSNQSVATASTAVYASGYAQWKIMGTCEGATGLYASAGKIEVVGADISSKASDYSAPGSGSHANGIGSAIVINSRDAHAGDISLTISGDTEVESQSGFAIEESVNTSANATKVSDIIINEGSFQGGTNPNTGESQAAIVMSSQTSEEAEVVVYGGTIDGPVVVKGDDDKDLEDFLAPDVHTTTVYIDGAPNTVVSAGDAPDVYAKVADHPGESVKWWDDEETLKGDLTLAELEISRMDTTWNSAHTKITAITPHAQVLYVGDDDHNITLKVGRVVLGPGARVIVNKGSKLIVDGEQGFIAAIPENIVLKASQDAQANFLFHPSVTSNRHPYATVEFVSKSWRLSDGSAMAWQRFGIPSFGALSEITATAPTAFARFNADANEWETIGIIGTMDYNQMATPFEYYQMLNNNEEMGTVVTMKGQLFGNDSPEFAIRGNFWNGFANSYMAPISGSELLQLIPNTVDKAFYLNKITGDQASWEPVTMMNVLMNLMDDIKPMQPFLIRNTKAAANVTVNYETAVYNPATSVPNSGNLAPRRAMNNVTFAKIGIQGEDGIDRILVAEDADFSAEFDNGYDAVKYMNDGINMYVSADEKMSNYATDNLNNTYVGFQTVNGGTYTMEFTNVQGEKLMLIDHETGARVEIVEGNTYEFTANGTNDYRFEIVEPAKLPTAIENTEAVKSAKGIYTITGQYVGEMNVWNTLPAGIYVVNGEKLVK